MCLTESVAFIILLQRFPPHSWRLHNTEPASPSFTLSRPSFSPSVTSIDQRGCFAVHRLQPLYPLNKNRLPKCDLHQHLLPVPRVRRSQAAFANQCECQRPWGGFLQNSCPTLTSDLSYRLKCPFVSLLHWPLRLILSFKLSLNLLNNVSTFLLPAIHWMAQRTKRELHLAVTVS